VLRRLQACEHLEIVGIVRSSRVMNPAYGFVTGALALFRRSGIAYSLYMFCATTLSDGLCALLGPAAVPMRSRGTRHGPAIRVHTTRNIHDAGGLAFLRDCAPDLLVSAFFDQRLKDTVLALPGYACLNIHPSLLPDFGGVDPVLQAKLQGAPALGVTVHHMTAVLDHGGVLAQNKVDVPAGASVLEATARLFDAGAVLLAQQIEQLRPGDAGTPPGPGGSYQGWPTPGEVRALRKCGTPLVRPSDPWRVAHSLRNVPGAAADTPARR
jgi:methionyl-tRNA formyltransferase